MKKIIKILLLLVLNHYSYAQNTPCTFVKQVDGIGETEPRIFKNTSGTDYYITARSSNGNTTHITHCNSVGSILSSRTIKFPNDYGNIVDLIVDNIDGTLVAVLNGGTDNYMFKYDYNANVFNWFRKFPKVYGFQNVHQSTASGSNYIVTGQLLLAGITICVIQRTTGAFSSVQTSSFNGEFQSAYNGKAIYGACRYYTNPTSIFNPALFEFNPSTGSNVWTKSYIKNTPTVRIYPVAPVIDNTELVQLSSGSDATFTTYQTGNSDVWLLKTTLSGSLIWTKKITIPGYSRLSVVKILNTSTGYYLLVNSYNGGTAANYFFVVKTDKNGNILWTNRYGISGVNAVFGGVENNGNLYLTATSTSYPGGGLVYLYLDNNGMTNNGCSFITQLRGIDAVYTNLQTSIPTNASSTTYNNSSYTPQLLISDYAETIQCSTTCCNTLSGSLATSVLAFYPFGNGSLNDLSGNINNLINTTSAYPTMDRSGNLKCAYHFDKTNGDFLNIPSSNTSFLNNITTSAFSISLWYQPTGSRAAGDYELLIGRGNTVLHCPDTWGEWSIGLFDCRKAAVGFDQYSHWQTSPLSCQQIMTNMSNSWHHLAFVYDPSNVSTPYQLYIDGILYSNSNGPCGTLSGNIGSMILGQGYTGDLDDIIIYKRALSASEVTTLYSLTGSCCDGVSSTYKLDNPIDESSSDAIKIYPNPTYDFISISVGVNTIHNVYIYNSTGVQVGVYEVNSSSAKIPVSYLTSGIYIVKVITDSGISIQKILKE